MTDYGCCAAQMLVPFGVNLIGIPNTSRSISPFHQCETLEDLPRFLETADYVVNPLPNTPQTQNIWNATLFARMKPTAIFINVGRGSAIVDADLITSLEWKQLAVKLDRYLNAMMELYRSPTYLLTPLMFASIHGHSSIVRFLLENYSHYCIVDALNYSSDFDYDSFKYEGYFYRQTALWLAVQNKHFNVVQILISLGKANVNHMADESEGKSWTPLGLACRDGQISH
ncbi:unnamed protein product [Adineta steineri]|uniref:D-isomer specific 2-hydroxyacid dehydrogenase NAD-binding domain-containing protein n=1 Tax=Adineta steineri TaxID=433720 RepID=A0A815HUV2_9BILA|nr:unnamed protein product [Adineta steineri]CAF1340825.1 unnamed protein product [Adineta steineri]CAF1356560.1 unnamed protein product [Adineta steineri]